MPLKSRRQFPPQYFIFYEARTGWQSPAGLDFDTTVQKIIEHRKANPRWENEWSTDAEVVSDELDTYTCKRINNDPNYCTDSPSPPFRQGSLSHRRIMPQNVRQADVRVAGKGKIAAGIGVLADWLGAGLKPVAKDLAESRAAICATCPKNEKATLLESIFAVPAMEIIRKQIGIRNDMKLETAHDRELGLCGVCHCVTRLKVFCPTEHIKLNTGAGLLNEFPDFCWVKKEIENIKPT